MECGWGIKLNRYCPVRWTEQQDTTAAAETPSDDKDFEEINRIADNKYDNIRKL